MSRQNRLSTLQSLAMLVRDHDMARLQRLSAARDMTRDKIEQLAAPQPTGADPALFAARQTHLHWAARQRMQMNMTLATQTANLLEQRAKTARSFGRADALSRLLSRTKSES